jgi:acyl transferase domain-containing protein/3-hydroxymyristoyl/3-hydroxydecanoyl-(acyl carrier protein) dehydratase/1-acyl-sn-glycerol-3-phosphate acyltransferase
MTAFEPIAIVGRACVLPGALSPEQLWELVAAGRDAVTAVDPGRWRVAPADVMCEPSQPKPDRTWTDRGGYVRGFESIWEPEGFAIPATELGGLDPLVHWVLHCARAALADAGDDRRGSVTRPRVAAVFGNLGFPTESMNRYAEALWFGATPRPDARNRFMSGGTAAVLERALGLMPGVMALDTACASSLYAIELACALLQDRRADRVLAGAVNRADDLFLHVGFAALGALSRSGRSRPFHAEADGLLPAEGAGFVALERLADARAACRHVYGIIRGVGLSNDGRGRGFLAPDEHGQRRAITQAYARAGVDPRSVSLLECHATGTVVGDATELRSYAAVFEGVGELPIGSLKSNLGHAITAAGVAGLIKLLEALRHEQRPPSLHAEQQNPTLAGTPFRVLRELEPWPRGAGPRIAGLSAFGFGGNNAHLIVSEDDPELPAEACPIADPVPLAIVGVGTIVGDAHDTAAFERALRSGASLVRDGAAASGSFDLQLSGLRFPPHDLRRTLPQQLLLLAAAREAVTGTLERERSGVFVALEPDPEVCRNGARWRVAEYLRASGRELDTQWIEQARDAIAPALEAATVIGTMPNIPANRINAHFDLGGPSWSVFASEASGRHALALACRALREGQLDAALVGAVDLSCQDVHRTATKDLDGREQPPGDAAVVLLVRRLADAESRGDAIFAVLEPDGAAPVTFDPDADAFDLRARFGRSWAAGDLRDIAAAVLTGRHGLLPDGQPSPSRMHVTLGSAAIWQGDTLALRPVPLSRHKIEGQLAFVFNGAGAAYASMGAELLAAIPSLGESVRARSPVLASYFERPWPADEADVPPLQKLWAASYLCQLHAKLSTDVLGLRCDAVIGYSSGESNSLFATGIWTDHDAMVAACSRSDVFTEQIGGQLQAVARAWDNPTPAWQTWTVLAPIQAIEAALADEPRAHLTVIHHDNEAIVAGDPQACARVRARLGHAGWVRVHYDLAVHTTELAQIREAWLELHRRPVTPRSDIRVYSGAHAGAYTPSTEACAQAILGQAERRLDFRAVIEQAYADGVRVFVEHGPRAVCTRWIRKILGKREAVVVALDRPGASIEAALEAATTLAAAGVECNVDRLRAMLGKRRSGSTLLFETHPRPIVLPRRPEPAMQTMIPAPKLPPVDAPSPMLETRRAEVAPQNSSPIAAAYRAQVEELGRRQREFVEQQTALHQQFLALREQTMNMLFAAARGRGPAIQVPPNSPSPPPIAQVVPPKPAEQPPAKALAPVGPTGPKFTREQLAIHAGGRISTIFGPQFAIQDNYVRQVRMPEPPLLLADRVTGLAAEPMSMKLGTIWTETDVTRDAWYLHDARMPAGIMIESGQADLMLISYLGVDAENKSERIYRLLGCTLTYHGGLPEIGDTLCYDIHLDGHAKQGGIRLMFFHYDCHIAGKLRLSVRKGQAGFFTDAELANSDGCLWRPEDQAIVDNPRLDPPALRCDRGMFTREQVAAFAAGRPWECFGPAWNNAQTHTRTPRITGGRMLFFDRVDRLEVRGGPWERGYLAASCDVLPDHWFFDGHFHNDPCMPGTLMFEGCLQAMAFYLAALGYSVARDGWRFEPVQGEPFALSCRGQVTPRSRLLRYEVFVEEVIAGPIPTLYADLLCTVDGLKAFHARRVGLRLVPAWPLDEGHPLLDDWAGEARPVARAGDFNFDYPSMLACAQGRPTTAFGPIYARFDGVESVARLPNPPYHFISRAVRVAGEIGIMRPGVSVEVEYDIPPDAWYFAENACRVMPFAVLLEAALQPCGWLASHMGCALSSEQPMMFRNLDGTGTIHAELREHDATLHTKVVNTRLSKTASMIIVGFTVECRTADALIYTLDTVFGFFPAAAFENQAGLPTTPEQRALFEAPAPQTWPLAGGRSTPGRARMARPMLLMLDRVTAFDPAGGRAGLGSARAEKDVDPGEWFFKAHFFQDPVQPGSLGIEAMLQLLQWTMLELGMDAGMTAPRFEAIAVGDEHTWKYRGQVVPHNQRITTTLELTARGRDDRGAHAIGDLSLWVDGKRIYEAIGLGMRIVDDASVADGRRITLDPRRDRWIADHCPTYTVPALPMMMMVELLASAARDDERLLGLRDVRVKGWVLVPAVTQFRCERDRERVRLLIDGPEGEREVASGRLVLGRHFGVAPKPLPPLDGPEAESPYASAELFHGPAFQLLDRLIRTAQGASSWLRAASEIPVGRLNPALLDAATHGIAHDRLHPDKIAYPAWIPELELFGPTPSAGTVRCEVRAAGHVGSPDYPVFDIQLIGEHGVWAKLRLVEACFPKGRLGHAAPHERRAFLRDHVPVPGLSLAQVGPNQTTLNVADVEASDWLPGTVAGIYGTRDAATIAQKEHIAAAHGVHPRHIPEALPLSRINLVVEQHGDAIQVRGDGRGTLDDTPVRDFWTKWFNRGPWPVEDLYYGLIERFVDRVVVQDPAAFAGVHGRSLLYLGNHQVGVESLLFSIIASGLSGVPTVTLAKIEHKTTWLGRLIAHCFAYPGVRDPKLISFFDRNDKSSLARITEEFAAEMLSPGRSVMVHVEGTRSKSCAKPVEKMSGTFLDLAIAVGAPVVPVRFIGGLPVEPVAKRLEFPLGMAKQAIWIGRPIPAGELAAQPYGERKRLVIEAINALGCKNADERPLAPDPEFAARVEAWQAQRGLTHEHATLRQILAERAELGDEARRLIGARGAAELEHDQTPEGRWLADLGRWLLG